MRLMYAELINIEPVVHWRYANNRNEIYQILDRFERVVFEIVPFHSLIYWFFSLKCAPTNDHGLEAKIMKKYRHALEITCLIATV